MSETALIALALSFSSAVFAAKILEENGAARLANGWLDSEWIVIFALALSFSFALASPLNMAGNRLYVKWQYRLQEFENKIR